VFNHEDRRLHAQVRRRVVKHRGVIELQGLVAMDAPVLAEVHLHIAHKTRPLFVCIVVTERYMRSLQGPRCPWIESVRAPKLTPRSVVSAFKRWMRRNITRRRLRVSLKIG
jgi:hypothetical protein